MSILGYSAMFLHLLACLLAGVAVAPLRAVHRNWARWCTAYLVSSGFLEGALWLWSPLRLHLSGDLPARGGFKILVANHQLDVDGVLLWTVLREAGEREGLKIVLKEQLRKAPLLGPCMSLLEYVFLAREWQADRHRLGKQLAAFRRDAFPTWLLIFPEGTTVNERAMAKSVAYAREHGRPELQHLLLPRVRGVQACLDALDAPRLGGADGLEDTLIVDATVAFGGYSGEVPTWELGYERATDTLLPNLRKLVSRANPVDMHVHVEVFDATKVRGNMQAFLDSQWQAKDRLMAQFINSQEFATRRGKRVIDVRADLLPPLAVWVVVAGFYGWLLPLLWRFLWAGGPLRPPPVL